MGAEVKTETVEECNVGGELKSLTAFKKIKEAALPLMVQYQSDLELDKTDICKNAGVPFLHFTRTTGTLLVMLTPADNFPKKGEYIPHLFSRANREQLLKNIATMSKYYKNGNNGPCEMVFYFDGERLKKISVEKAAEIGLAHARSVEAVWGRRK